MADVTTDGAITRGLNWLLGAGWQKRAVRLLSYAKILVIAIAAGSISLNMQDKIHWEWLSSHWPQITSVCMILREVMSAVQTDKQENSTTGQSQG